MRVEERRVRKLQAEGRITRREADEIAASLDALTSRSHAARRASRYRLDLSALGVLKARFLVGEFTRAELGRGLLRIAIAGGLAMGAVFTLATAVFTYDDAFGRAPIGTVGEWLARALSCGWMLGLVFGVSSYSSHLSPLGVRLALLRRKVDIARPERVARRSGGCPSCGAKNRRWGLPRAVRSTAWVLLPWFAINELYLGQRLPRRHERCPSCEAIYVECAACEASIENLDWCVRGPFWNRRGAECSSCGKAVPSWRNAFALLVELLARGVAVLLGRLRPTGPATREEAR